MLLLTVRVGWAKPVPVDMRNFRHPKRDMAITALAGPAANFLLATAALGVASLIYHFAPQGTVAAYAIYFFLYMAVLSVGLGIFNLVPIPPLDGSKILFALLPDRIYYQYLRYERFFILAVVLLAWMGVFSVPLSFCMEGIVRGLCAVTAFRSSWRSTISSERHWGNALDSPIYHLEGWSRPKQRTWRTLSAPWT